MKEISGRGRRETFLNEFLLQAKDANIVKSQKVLPQISHLSTKSKTPKLLLAFKVQMFEHMLSFGEGSILKQEGIVYRSAKN